MSKFTTRIEMLNWPQDQDYALLHEAMKEENFTKWIHRNDVENPMSGAEKLTLRLPDAEYNIEGNYTKEEVLQAAIRAATKTGCEFRVLVTESVGSRLYYNLLPIINIIKEDK